MLFETVYGPELECLFALICTRVTAGASVPRATVYEVMVPNGSVGQLKNVQDAIAFLRSARLLDESTQGIRARLSGPFRPSLLRGLREIQADPGAEPLDRLYMALVDDIFIRPNRLFRPDLHAAANGLGGPPLSQERINAWARVLEYMGLGRRAAHGFQCAYTPSLVGELLAQHPPGRYEIERVLDEMLEPYLPVRTRDGEPSLALHGALAQLQDSKMICLTRLQDSPARSFMPQRYTHLNMRRRRRASRPNRREAPKGLLL